MAQRHEKPLIADSDNRLIEDRYFNNEVEQTTQENLETQPEPASGELTALLNHEGAQSYGQPSSTLVEQT